MQMKDRSTRTVFLSGRQIKDKGLKMILTVCMSPCTDITIELDALNVGMTNVIKNKSVTYAGKALNVAVGIARLGGQPYTTGIMYNENGYMFEHALEHEGVPFRFIWNKGRVRENYKFIDHRSMLTEVNDVGEEVSKDKTDEILSAVSELSQKSSITVLSGGLPRGVDDSYYGELVKSVAPGSLKIVDASGKRMLYAVEQGVDLVKPNLDELEHMLGKKFTCKEDMLSGCYELLDRGAKRVLLSLIMFLKLSAPYFFIYSSGSFAPLSLRTLTSTPASARSLIALSAAD